MPTCVVLSMRGTEVLAEEAQFVDKPGFINDFIPDPTFLGSWDDSRIVLMGPSSPDETLSPFPAESLPSSGRQEGDLRGTLVFLRIGEAFEALDFTMEDYRAMVVV